VERIDASASGRVEVHGRWFGVRGRRFVRPTLTLRRRGGREVRALAELEHKPWAAEDGEIWMAAFSLKSGLDGAREVELSVAPDIAVALRRPRQSLAEPGDQLSVDGPGRSPRFKADREEPVESRAQPSESRAQPSAGTPDTPDTPSAQAEPTTPAPTEPRRRPSAGSLDLERLGSRLAAANQALAQERERRTASDRVLEEERAASRRLRTELGQVKAELELARTAHAEAVAATEDAERTGRADAAAAAQELERAQEQLREAERRHDEVARDAGRRHDELAGQHEQTTELLAAAQAELQELNEALESGRQALTEERAESGRLRSRVASLHEAASRSISTSGDADAPDRPQTSGPARAPTASRTPDPSSPPRASRTAAASRTPTASRTPDPSPSPSRRASRAAAAAESADDTRPFTPIFDGEGDADNSPGLNPANRRSSHHQSEWAARTPPPAGYTPRPLNPSLRHRTWWLGRLVALVFLLVVIAAVVLLIRSTMPH
jgi:hypothetical protein